MSTKSLHAELLGRQEPRLKVAPSVQASEADDVIDLCAGYGLHLDPWQRIALECGLGLREDGMWSCDTVAVCAPRQSGKGCLIEALALAGVLLFEERVIACSAHEARTTRLSFERVLAWFDSFDDLRKRVASVQRWVGREQIRFRGGQLLVFPARSRGALRGYSCDRLLLDEAQYLTDAQHEAVLPTLSARPRTQVWHLGTVPTHLGDGEVFGRLRSDAVAGSGGRLCYLEWSADPGADLDDREQWANANPALGRRVSLEAVETERRELSDQGFSRERMGLWPADCIEEVFNLDRWAQLIAPGPARGTKVTAIGIDATPLPTRAFAVAVCWRLGDDRYHVELNCSDLTDPIEVLDRVLKLAVRRTPILIDRKSPANELIDRLTALKYNVVPTGPDDMSRAAGGLLADVAAGRLTHANEAPLNDAVAGARKRPIGADGAFGWERSNLNVSLAPLNAASLARSAAVSSRRGGGATFA